MAYSENLVRVNILTRGRIRWLNVYGPIYNSTISRNIFNVLIKDPSIRIEVLDWYNPKKVIATYGIDPNAGKKAESTPIKETVVETEVVNASEVAAIEVDEANEVLNVETTEVDTEVINLETNEDNIPDATNEVLNVEPVVEETKVEILNEEPVKIEESINATSVAEEDEEEIFMSPEGLNDVIGSEVSEVDLDKMIEEATADYDPESEYVDNPIVVEETKEIVKYSKKKLSTMTKAEMKQVLLDRGYTDGEYAPRYHDTLDKLKAKILKTQ